MLGGNDTRHIPLGDSGTAAIVVSVLYAIGAAAIILSWQKTGFHYYKALITSTACEFPHPSPAAGLSMCQRTFATARSSHKQLAPEALCEPPSVLAALSLT